MGTQQPAADEGATGAWQKLLKLQTTASAMHTTAHPDDEHGGVLALFSRGQGARVSLLTLNRGESGDNAIGSELFDAVGLIRTEELLVADRYYGVDRQYFTTVIDYGFSKRLDETLEKWGRENVLRDVVRDHPPRSAVRPDRALPGQRARRPRQPRGGRARHAGGVQGRRRSGEVSRADCAGLRPWQPLKLYMGGVRENEDWTLRVDTGEYSPVLGDSYQTFAGAASPSSDRRTAVGSCRSRARRSAYYKRLESVVDAPAEGDELLRRHRRHDSRSVQGDPQDRRPPEPTRCSQAIDARSRARSTASG